MPSTKADKILYRLYKGRRSVLYFPKILAIAMDLKDGDMLKYKIEPRVMEDGRIVNVLILWKE